MTTPVPARMGNTDTSALSPQDWADLRVFVEVVSHLSFTRAAERLFVSQSTVSRQLSRLERRLGQVLVKRTSRTVELTPLGKALFPHLSEAVKAVEHTLRTDAAGTGAARSSLATSHLPQNEVLVVLRGLLPGVEWTLRGLTVDQGLTAVTDGDVGHLATLWCPRLRPSGPAAVRFDAVVPLDWRVSVPADHPLAGRERLALADLRDAEWAIPAERDVEFDLLRSCADAGFRPDIRIRALGALEHAGAGLVGLVGPWQRDTAESRVLPCSDLPPLHLVVVSRVEGESGAAVEALVTAVTALAEAWSTR